MVRQHFRGTARIAASTGCLLAACIALQTPAWAQNGQANGVEVLARGPVHEAFAETVVQQPAPTLVIPRQPPEAIEELPPDQRPAEEGVQWIPGYWSWDDERKDFIWISGVWRVAPPDRQWMPGHWTQIAGGWQWSPGLWVVAQQQNVELLPPPPEPLNAVPAVAAPTVTSFYVPGNYLYRANRYVWRAGFWLEHRPGWVYIPAHFVWTPVGYVYVEGYWDLDLRRRGLLFAPVYFTRTVLVSTPVFQPTYVVRDDFLLGALFVQPGHRGYYFGDYYEATYARRGYVAWVDYRVGRSTYDPLYDYYRWHHRSDPRWDVDLRAVYVGRTAGTVVRPPRTLVQQTTVVNNTTINNTTINNTRNVTVNNTYNTVQALAPLHTISKTVVPLQTISQEQRLVEQRAAQNLRVAARQRNEAEARLLSQSSGEARPVAQPRTLAVNLPPARPSAAAASAPHNPVSPRAAGTQPGIPAPAGGRAERTIPEPKQGGVPTQPPGTHTNDVPARGDARREPPPVTHPNPVQPKVEPRRELPPIPNPRETPKVEPKREPPPVVHPNQAPPKVDAKREPAPVAQPARPNPMPPQAANPMPKVEPKALPKQDRPVESVKPAPPPKVENKPPMGGSGKPNKPDDDKKPPKKGDEKGPKGSVKR